MYNHIVFKLENNSVIKENYAYHLSYQDKITKKEKDIIDKLFSLSGDAGITIHKTSAKGKTIKDLINKDIYFDGYIYLSLDNFISKLKYSRKYGKIYFDFKILPEESEFLKSWNELQKEEEFKKKLKEVKNKYD